MKRISISLASVALLALGGVLWHGSAHSQPPAKPLVMAGDPLAEWIYPGAKKVGESNGERLPSIPLHGVQLQTTDPIDKVFFFFRKKTDPRFTADKDKGWNAELQPALLMTQFGQGAQSWNLLHTRRKDADTALLMIRQSEQTITIQLSRDPQDKSTTDILLVADEHEP